MKSPTNRKAAILLSVLSVLILAAGVTSCTSQMGRTAADTHAAKLQQQVPDQAGVTKETEKRPPEEKKNSYPPRNEEQNPPPPPTKKKSSSRSLKHGGVSSSPQKQN